MPALRDSRDVFDDIHGMIFGPNGLVTWTSNDYNKGAALVFIGRIDETGRIVDSHRVGRLADVWSTVGFDDLGVLTSTTYDGEPYLLDTVVDVDVADRFDTGGVDSAGGARAVVLSTECAEQYDGRQLFWGVEWIDYGDNGPRFESPLFVKAVLDTTVAEVLHVTAIILNEEMGCCLELGGLQITVELLDGTRTVLEISTAS